MWVKKIKKFYKTKCQNHHLLWMVVFIILTPLIILGVLNLTNLFLEKHNQERVEEIRHIFYQEAENALAKTKQAAAEGKLNQYIVNNDAVNAGIIIEELAEEYNFSAMLVTNEDGVVLYRLSSPRAGDYVFQTTAWGRKVVEGESVWSVGVGRGSIPFLVNTATPIKQDGVMIGSLLGGIILDDQYAQEFKKKYLLPGEEVVIYSKEAGVEGVSFYDDHIKEVIGDYFNENTDWVQSGRSELADNKFIIDDFIGNIGNIVLADAQDDQVGGILIFLPSHGYLPYVLGAILGILAVFWLIIHLHKRHKKNKHRNIFIIILFIALLVVVSWLSSRFFISFYRYDIVQSPYVIYNSTINFRPETDLFDVNREQRVSVVINTGGESINAASAQINYNPQMMRVVDVIMTNSFCERSFLIEKNIDNDLGEVNIACGKPNGFKQPKAILAELLVQPLKAGEFFLRFGKNTQVLANDGLGTNVLRKAIDGSYRAFNPNSGGNLVFFSYTHPNSSRWYKQKKIHFDWVDIQNNQTNFIYAFDHSPNTRPDGQSRLNDNELNLSVTDDGVYYFHLLPLNAQEDEETLHYKISIDSTPPSPAIIKVSDQVVKRGDLVRFEFIAQGDNLSGVQNNFYVSFNGGTHFPTLGQLSIPFFELGKQKVSVRVFDNAGNFSDNTVEIKVEK